MNQRNVAAVGGGIKVSNAGKNPGGRRTVLEQEGRKVGAGRQRGRKLRVTVRQVSRYGTASGR